MAHSHEVGPNDILNEHFCHFFGINICPEVPEKKVPQTCQKLLTYLNDLKMQKNEEMRKMQTQPPPKLFLTTAVLNEKISRPQPKCRKKETGARARRNFF